MKRADLFPGLEVAYGSADAPMRAVIVDTGSWMYRRRGAYATDVERTGRGGKVAAAVPYGGTTWVPALLSLQVIRSTWSDAQAENAARSERQAATANRAAAYRAEVRALPEALRAAVSIGYAGVVQTDRVEVDLAALKELVSPKRPTTGLEPADR